MKQIESVAVLMTCHNRRETTLKCLGELYDQKLPEGVHVTTYLVADGCTDGTSEAVGEQFTDVNILQGDGTLYWCGGMRLAWAEAMKGDYDAYLWLNDDTMLLPRAIRTLLTTADELNQREGCDGIVVGSCRDPVTGKRSYGGAIRKRSNAPVIPTDHPQYCDMINGNVVLIPHDISRVVGNINPKLTHYGGDNDYGLRAIEKGFKIWIAPGFQGLCSVNSYPAWANPQVPLRERWRSLHSPKGQPPYDVYVYARHHSGLFWPMDLVKLYLRVFVPRLYAKVKRLLKSQ